MKNKKTIYYLVLTIATLTLPTITIVHGGTGSIRIDPPLPTMTKSPATFDVWVQGTGSAHQPHIFLVMTKACYEGLSGDVTVSWSGGSGGPVTVTGWKEETSNGVKVPTGSSPGAGYTVASLKDHLGTSDSVYWAISPILDNNPLVPGETYELTVSMSSTHPEMLVYVIGKSDSSEVFDMAVPPTIPGFVVPELPLGTIASLLSMIGSALLFKLKKK
jgi:hypothetical protein